MITDKNFILFASQPYAFSILRPLQSEIRKQGYQAYWFVTGQNGRFLLPDEQRANDLQAVRRLNPDAVFSASNWIPLVFPGLKVQLFHGFNVEKRKARKGHFRIRGMFDLYCTQGPSTTDPFLKLADKYGYFKVAETGWCKMDPLFQDGYTANFEFDNPDKPVVMFASTFTESLTAAPHLLEPIRQLILDKKYNWLLTLHPKMNESVIRQYQSLDCGNAKYFDSSRLIDMFVRADVLVSDTSSVVPEFLLQDKPVVTYRNRRPAPHLLDFSDFAELEKQIDIALQRPQSLMKSIKKFNTQNHPYQDGNSAARVLQSVENFEQLKPELKKSRPLNLRRRIQHYLKTRNSINEGQQT